MPKKVVKIVLKTGKYNVSVDGQYIYIEHTDYSHKHYQLKLEGEGLVLDTIENKEVDGQESLFQCMNSECLLTEDK